jgi:AraC-like DNA-binding protein/quercetin dioxygenase-like cupin family protein
MSRKRRTVADEPYLVVRTSAADLGSSVGEHAHDWHQLVHVRSGLAVVRSDGRTWLAPPTWAVWLPAGVRHAIRFAGPTALRVVYLRADPPRRGVAHLAEAVGPARSAPGLRGGAGTLPARAGAMPVSPLLRELVERATVIGMLDRRDPLEAALATLLVGELTDVGPPPLAVPEPASALGRRVAELLRAGTTVARAAAAVGVGRRTVERVFQAETGLPVGRWRQYRLLLRGLEEVADGATVQDASVIAGYGTPSAYVAAFRAAFGTTPARFLTPTAEQGARRSGRARLSG